MSRYVCIHGHFYQPARENPWLDIIELQPEAHPYHDWNERITDECYKRNARSRILSEDGRIRRMMNNYAWMSFNFGPTLFSWLENADPETYTRIIEADRESISRCSGHGNAIAQCYNHMIMPLASYADKRTQIIWGISDFRHRFNREPEGIWLPETAVDLETLEILAEEGIKFTILAPHQAARVRQTGSDDWKNSADGFDLQRAYRCNLPSGRSIALFFYDEALTRDVAFAGLLKNGISLANSISSRFSPDNEEPRLVHLASDGESYGHHHKFGEMALSFAIEYLQDQGVRITNYAEFLELCPPLWEVEIVENSSWSCSHGVERWRNDCGCNSGRFPGYNQQWRRPLRDAMQNLRDIADEQFSAMGGKLFLDPGKARDEYINLLLNPGSESRERFLTRHRSGANDSETDVIRLKLLEMQRFGMLMFTSCGWFFDDLAEIHTVQVIRYASIVLQILGELGIKDAEEKFLKKLEDARSNLDSLGSGRDIYARDVQPRIVTPEAIAAHWTAKALLFSNTGKTDPVSGIIILNDSREIASNNNLLKHYQISVTDKQTGATRNFIACVWEIGNDKGIAVKTGGAFDEEAVNSIENTLKKGNPEELRKGIPDLFPASRNPVDCLVGDGRIEYEQECFERSETEINRHLNSAFVHYINYISFLEKSGMRIPSQVIKQYPVVSGIHMRKTFAESDDPKEIEDALKMTELVSIEPDWSLAESGAQVCLDRAIRTLESDPGDITALIRAVKFLRILNNAPIHPDKWYAENCCYDLLNDGESVTGERLDPGQAALYRSLLSELCAETGIKE